MIVRNEKVLIVDDAQFMRLTIKRTLQKLGFLNIFEATDVINAIAIYKQINPELVTMDITMPGDSGLDGIKLIKNINPKAKIIMISAVANRDNIIKAFSLGAVYFVSKPFTEEKFKEVLEKAVPNPISEYIPNQTDTALNSGTSNAVESKSIVLISDDEMIEITCRSGDIIGRCDKCKNPDERSQNYSKCNDSNEKKNCITCKHITISVEQAKLIFENNSFYIIPLPGDASQKYPLKSGDKVNFGKLRFNVK